MLTFGLNLDLTPRTPSDNPMDVARRVVSTWCETKLGAIPESRRTLFRRRDHDYAFEDTRMWELTLEQPADDHDGVWATEVRLMHTQSAQELQAAVTMRTIPKTPSLAPLRYFVETPRFIRLLESNFQLTVAGDRPSSIAELARNSADIGKLATFLQNPTRSLPAILVTGPAHASNDDPAAALAKHLAEFLFPMAHVFGVGREATYALTDSIGKKLSVFDGGVRVYWPGFALSDNPRNHRLFWKDDVLASAQYAPDDPYKLLRFNTMALLARATAARFEYPRRMLDVLTEARAADLANTIASQDLEQVKRRLSALEGERNYYKELSDDLEKRLREATSRLEELEAPETGEAIEASWELEGIDEAIAKARSDFSATLLFPNEFSTETRMQAGYWYNVLKSLHELCLMERKGLGRGRGDALRELLIRNVKTPGKWKRADTSIYVTNPETGNKVHTRDRVHLKEGAPKDTESAYWEPLGERESLRYLIGRLGTHA